MRPRGLAWLLLALVGAALLAASRHLDVVEIRGRSMAPTLLPGDRLIVARLPVRLGDVVVAADPRTHDRELIKRVAAIGGPGITLRGDDPAASTDARTFGAIPADRVTWRAVARYWPIDRIGWVPNAPDA